MVKVQAAAQALQEDENNVQAQQMTEAAGSKMIWRLGKVRDIRTKFLKRCPNVRPASVRFCALMYI